MLQLRAYAWPDQAPVVGRQLAGVPGVRHVVMGGSTDGGMVQITAELPTDVADAVLDVLRACDVAADDVILWRTSTIPPLGWRRRRAGGGGSDSTVWAEVTGRAREHAQLAAVYVTYMAAAGVVAGVGVLTGSSILVVGAMALSPDLLPIAAAVGLLGRRWLLASRAVLTLFFGLAVVIAAATIATLLLRWLDRIDEDLALADSVLGPSLTEVGPGTVLVALAAGVAGMLAYETAGAVAVGVAISVTTIPAAAYVGAAIGLGGREHGCGALGVLVVNVLCIELACASTL